MVMDLSPSPWCRRLRASRRRIPAGTMPLFDADHAWDRSHYRCGDRLRSRHRPPGKEQRPNHPDRHDQLCHRRLPRRSHHDHARWRRPRRHVLRRHVCQSSSPPSSSSCTHRDMALPCRIGTDHQVEGLDEETTGLSVAPRIPCRASPTRNPKSVSKGSHCTGDYRPVSGLPDDRTKSDEQTNPPVFAGNPHDSRHCHQGARRRARYAT